MGYTTSKTIFTEGGGRQIENFESWIQESVRLEFICQGSSLKIVVDVQFQEWGFTFLCTTSIPLSLDSSDKRVKEKVTGLSDTYRHDFEANYAEELCCGCPEKTEGAITVTCLSFPMWQNTLDQTMGRSLNRGWPHHPVICHDNGEQVSAYRSDLFWYPLDNIIGVFITTHDRGK